jgi:YegS/Rv2252/BmrU family lipid kinase
MTTDIKKIMFVYNPMAGGEAAAIEDDILLHSRHHGWITLFYFVTGINDKQDLGILINRFDPQVVVAAGGDGTVNLVAAHLLHTNRILGIIPAGSTNGLAKELNIPIGLNEALDVIASGKSKRIDTLSVNGLCVVHICDVGFNARILKRISKSGIRGKLSYLWYGLSEFMNYQPARYQVATTERRFEGEAVMIIITNARGFGYNLHVNPDGKIDDGYFEISVIKSFPRSYLFKLLYRIYRKNLNKSGYNLVIKTQKAVVKNPAHSEVHIDGEPVAGFDTLNVEIIRRSLEILVP